MGSAGGGILSSPHPWACVPVPGLLVAHGRDIVLSCTDVSEVQLAKATIRAGIELLLSAAGSPAEALGEVVIAGAFDTYAPNQQEERSK